MPNIVNNSQEGKKLNSSDVASEFESLKISVLQKAKRVSLGNQNQVTIGPNSTFSYDDINDLEKKENIQNSCNIHEDEKNKIITENYNHISTRNSITFSIKKILYENELQRKELVRQKMRKRIEEMERSLSASRKEIEIYHSILSVQREQVRKDELSRLEAEEERQAQQMELRRKHEQQLLAQRIKEQKEKLERDAEEERKKIKEQEEMIMIQNNFHEKFRDFELLTNSCKEKYIIEPYIEKIHEFRNHMETIGSAARAGRLTVTDFEFAKITVQNIEEVLRHFKIEIERINAMHDAKIAQREQELKEAEALQLRENHQLTQIQQEIFVPEPLGIEVTDSVNEEIENVPSTETANAPDIELYKFFDKESLQIFVESDELINSCKEKYEIYIKSIEGKQFRSQSQKKIINPINALSLQSKEFFQDQYERLRFVLSGNLSSDSRADAYIKNTLAIQIISQGENVVSSKPEAAYPIAAIAVALWNEWPEFGDLLLANFRIKCPFIVPVFFPRLTGQTDMEYYKSLGYKYNENGIVEDHIKFLKRITGLMRLYSSIIVTRQRQGIMKNHPHGLQFAWRWLAAMLNNEPQTQFSDIYATLIVVVLEVTGHYLWTAYPKQFPKLLSLMITDYYPIISKIRGINDGPLDRLEEFLKQCLTTKTIPPPKGELPPNYW
ncbi:mRNA export factor GLE1 [Leptopilina boulardi]|uniref:mRNA export factor GLE1 n=1 Tax=Leptopilina boulardi TaxID=63433 RepID=UPI0021F669EC|nr:mRNA export factor GLE1 [Leptopilina boulardi]